MFAYGQFVVVVVPRLAVVVAELDLWQIEYVQQSCTFFALVLAVNVGFWM